MLVLCTTNLKFTLYKPNQLDQDSIERWAYVNMVMNFQVPHKYDFHYQLRKCLPFKENPASYSCPYVHKKFIEL